MGKPRKCLSLLLPSFCTIVSCFDRDIDTLLFYLVGTMVSRSITTVFAAALYASAALAAALEGRYVEAGLPAHEVRDSSSWPHGPFRTEGRDIVNARGDKIKWAGVNWPMSGTLSLKLTDTHTLLSLLPLFLSISHSYFLSLTLLSQYYQMRSGREDERG